MRKISRAVYWLIFIASIAAGLYVGGWHMFIQPILEAGKHFDAGTLTGVIIATTALKCIFASAVGTMIVYIGTMIAGFVAAIIEK